MPRPSTPPGCSSRPWGSCRTRTVTGSTPGCCAPGCGRQAGTPGPLARRLGWAIGAEARSHTQTREWGAAVVAELVRGSSSPAQQMVPVRFSADQHARLRAWSAEHGFSMATVIRGLVNRFLESQQPERKARRWNPRRETPLSRAGLISARRSSFWPGSSSTASASPACSPSSCTTVLVCPFPPQNVPGRHGPPRRWPSAAGGAAGPCRPARTRAVPRATKARRRPATS